MRVPATTANVGPGFDSLGIALQLHNEVELVLAGVPEVEIVGDIPREQSHGAMKMVMESARAFFRAAKQETRGVKVQVTGPVPIARGLGSSVTVRLGVVAGLNRLYGNALTSDAVLRLVSELEGHPDNAAPALLGGLVASGTMSSGAVACVRKPLPETLGFVAAIPDFEVETKKARELLPSSLPFEDAVHNVNRVALLVAAFWSGDFGMIGEFLDDRLHQPARSKLVPQLFPCIEAAKAAGAIGGWLSGSGSTVIALTKSNTAKVGTAMAGVFEQSGVTCKIVVMSADNTGVTFREA